MTEERTIKADDFLVIRQRTETPEMRQRMEEKAELNRHFLADLAEVPKNGRLSGSFIYAHPPDYRGRPMLKASVGDWRSLFREFKEMGLDTAIFQAAAWIDFKECYYPSKLFRDFRSWNVIGPLTEAASAEGIRLFLGGSGVIFGNQELGVGQNDQKQALKAAHLELACYRELLQRFQGSFQGYYLSSETGYTEAGSQNPGHLGCYHAYFKAVTTGVRELTPDLPILASPFSPPCPGLEDRAVDYLTRLFADCPIDIIAPQDSAGTISNLGFLERGLGIWKRVCDTLGAAFWVNCESFDIRSYSSPLIDIVPARSDRFAVQLDSAARAGAEKVITWEAPYFMSAAGGPGALKLRAGYLAHRKGK